MEDTLIREGDNPDITKERRNATFRVKKLAAFIHGSEEIVRRRKEIYDAVEREPRLKNSVPIEFLAREERHEEQARRAVAMTDVATDIIDGSDMFGEGIYYQSLIMGRDLHSLSLHYSMVLPAIQNQADDEQLDEWLGPIISRSLISTYAQTELGHGTNLSKLETTATYDPKTQEFILHSPTITATKWWPGALGKSSNYAIVMAQLYTNGKWHGPHPFFVQLRDAETHMPLKGVIVGDIGPKLGINGSDNGFLRFNNFRIPRKTMFMKNAKVLSDGTYVPPKHAKLGFGAMVFVRSIMIKDQSMQLGSAITIAVRYSAIRRQGEIVPNSGEVQILDYQTQQLRLFPQISRTLAFLFAAYEVKDLYLRVTTQLQEGNTELLPELHGLSSGLKSVVSWETAQGIEQCRLACGGHGYSQASAFPEIYSYAVGGCTYEGENIVMLLQVAR
jgi:acyl-CoA oxidase